MVCLEPNSDYEDEEEWDSETETFAGKDVAKVHRHRFRNFSDVVVAGIFAERRETVSVHSIYMFFFF